ncbi:MAG: YiiX/YebB-like N1pC/P60 family cysteine hydrolase [Betaproteobacteria bacterium]
MSTLLDRAAAWIGGHLSRYLSQPSHVHSTAQPTDPARLMACLKPGDVLLVEGQTRVSTAIKYLTQSTWSHAALYVGDATGLSDAHGLSRSFFEADIREGVRAVSVAEFTGLHCRVCRPVGMNAAEVDAVTAFVMARLGHRYDVKNVLDLARYLFPTPPVPLRWRRGMLALGSGDPTRAICSTLIAKAFQSVGYPILPVIKSVPSRDPMCPGCVDEILHIRHHSLFVPRDFDVSPYFAVIKPTLAAGFDHRVLAWHDPSEHEALPGAVITDTVSSTSL